MSSTLPVEFEQTEKLGYAQATELTKLSVLIPVFNERLTIQRLIDQVSSADLPASIELEMVVVDDGSTDGTRDVLKQLDSEYDQLNLIFHESNQGKGTAVRTAIGHATGDIAIIQDADLEYSPEDYPRLLAPILAGEADAVYGSRFSGESRRVIYFWHSLANKVLTLFSNAVNDLNLSDMETCYKAVRLDTLRNLRLSARTFTIEPELTARLAQWGARIYEVPISYRGRTYDEGKKIGAWDGVKACWEILRSGVLDRKFTDHAGFYILCAVGKADGYNRWILSKIQHYLGSRLLEAGSGIGNLSKLLLNRDRLGLLDYEPLYVSRLRQRFGHFDHVQISEADITSSDFVSQWQDERWNTIFSSNVIEHIEDDNAVLRHFHDLLVSGGNCIICVPAGPGLYTGVDAALGHYRRYTSEELEEKMSNAGFDIVHAERFNKVGAIAWWISGRILRRRRLNPGQMIWFNRILPIVKLVERVLPVRGMSLLVVGRKRDGTLDEC